MSKKATSQFSKQELLQQEETLEIQKRKRELIIGIPKVILTPSTVFMFPCSSL